MAAPILPEELQAELDNIAGKYIICIHTQQYNVAQSIITDLYNRMLSWQDKHRQRFHKGFPIHNIGYTLFLQKKYPEARRYFILAYIEDLLSADKEDEADALPAGQALLLGYHFTPQLLQILKRKVKELKGQGKMPLKPDEVVKELEESKTSYRDIEGKVTVVQKEAPLRPFTAFDMGWEKRVFVGGSIGLKFIIDKIADIVGELGYEPIVCDHFDAPKEMENDVRRKCLILLNNCKYAIFDVTEHKGQLLEIERVPEYEVLTLVVCADTKQKDITEMVKSLERKGQIKINSYSKFPEDVKAIVQEFLKA